MINRLSASFLIKSVLVTLASLVTLILADRVWNTWQDLDSSRLSLRIADASGEAFKVLVAIRTDRSTTARTWNAPDPISPDVRSYLTPIRNTEVAALQASITLLDRIPFSERDTLLPALRASFRKLTALQAEYWEGVAKPKADRRPGLADEYLNEGIALQATLEKISARLFAEIKQAEAFTNQMMEIKQLAWMVRNAAGEASLIVSTGLSKGQVPADAQQKYAGYIASSEALWAALEDAAYGMELPARFSAALAAAKKQFFDPDYVAKRDHLLKQLVAGERPDMMSDQWSPYTVPRLSTMQNVAEAALLEAKGHEQAELEAAQVRLVSMGGLLFTAILLSGLSILVVTRRVIVPLRVLRDAMLKLAGGDLSVEAPYTERKDEIGALAGVLASFRQQAVDKAAIEAEQQAQQARAQARQQTMETSIGSFDAAARVALDSLSDASSKMNRTSDDMEAIAARSNEQARTAAAAAEEASSNVAGIAAATEELSSSIAEISRQVAHATSITGRAVAETRQTDDTVRGLAEAAGQIGKVVQLISDIAGQTNLLALNATIEAARAGDAGKGFAVVASEVKSLASQTAKATEEIASQIAAVQTVTEAAVNAIRQIGTTIDEVSSVATSIAAAVEEQGASTQEIARNTQGAALRTREVSQTVGNVTEGADATGATAQAVKSAATALGAAADGLRGQVDGFLQQIRSA